MKNFKKIYAVLMLGFVFLTVASCRKDDAPEGSNPNDPNVPKIAFTTSYSIGSSVAISMKNTETVHIDWGNGEKIAVAANPAGGLIDATIKGSSVKIYAPSTSTITFLELNEMKINSLDVKNALGLRELYVFSNNLSSLDLSKNTALTQVDLQINKIKQNEMNKIINDLPQRQTADQAEIKVYDALYADFDGNELPSNTVKTNAESKKWSVNIQ